MRGYAQRDARVSAGNPGRNVLGAREDPGLRAGPGRLRTRERRRGRRAKIDIRCDLRKLRGDQQNALTRRAPLQREDTRACRFVARIATEPEYRLARIRDHAAGAKRGDDARYFDVQARTLQYR